MHAVSPSDKISFRFAQYWLHKVSQSLVYLRCIHWPFHPSLLQLLSNEKPHGTKIRTSQTQCMSAENWFSDDCHCRMSEVGNASNLLICSILHDKIGDNT